MSVLLVSASLPSPLDNTRMANCSAVGVSYSISTWYPLSASLTEFLPAKFHSRGLFHNNSEKVTDEVILFTPAGLAMIRFYVSASIKKTQDGKEPRSAGRPKNA